MPFRCMGVGVQLYLFLISELNGGERSASHLGCFIVTKRIRGTYRTGDWLDPRVKLGALEQRNVLAIFGN
jgi:hypothetical protein